MSITFHCEGCKKKVKAPDAAGGKYGNCPHCRHRCYIPLPPDENEPELKLAPIDDSEETQYSRMMRETHSLTKNILHEKAKDEPADAAQEGMSERELIRLVVMYLRLMADGQLEQAEKMAARLKPHGPAAKDILARMARTERPEPELEGIPPKLLMGLIKNLGASL
ncbi:MAG: hypothetical protein IH624_16665 [Phycisphaerae bacterium]|nr:hypothetical protein [Phycisphaerae bacterium]